MSDPAGTLLDHVRRAVAQPESTNQLLEEILAELKHLNNTERTGAVSSVEIKFLAPTKDNPDGKPQPVVKAYSGSIVPVEEAIEAYGRTVRLTQAAQMRNWADTVTELSAGASGA